MAIRTLPRNWRWGGIVLIVLTGLIHALEAPEYLAEVPYLGVSFVLNAIGGLVAAVGIARERREWGWLLGLVVAGGALVMHALSRSVGLPGFAGKLWFEPIGVLALLVEGLFVALAALVLTRRVPNTAR